ncbi:MAG: 23S rRNA (adenine(2503)-C(2))-methyltransferase RlmN [Lachnospiraceae bacterium]|nr:23S rRNA (adenine(2503)-C(2))-methyltransferase RlmN [Lachnospiraceae bacterium]
MEDIKSLSIEELQAYLEGIGEKKFRAAQVYEWLHKKLVTEWDAMTNISAALRKKLAEDFYLPKLEIATVLKSESDGTEKFLFKLGDGNVIESVLMRYEHGNSVCISSQVGCRMGCNFCASTIGGRIRDLTAGEMLEQIYHIQRYDEQRVSNVVVMGTGEPFDNFDNFCRFYERISDEKGLNISGRNITVSTCGIVPKIRELADKEYTLTLAVSLHSPTDELRRTFMPIANKYTIREIMDACDYYFKKTGRRITFEYSLINGVNDSAECADILSKLLKGKNAHVNLIPVNPVKERNYTKTNAEGVRGFKNILEKNGINATIRRGMGKDIDAACGQLRRSYTTNT